MQRRQFMQRAVGAAAVASTTALSAAKTFGANERVRVALVGCGRGMTVARRMQQVPGVEFVAACDVYEPHAAAACAWAETGCRAHHDFREVHDRKDVDALLVATGHRSTIAAHLGNIAYRTGRKFRWDAEREQILGDAEAAEILGRQARKPWGVLG